VLRVSSRLAMTTTEALPVAAKPPFGEWLATKLARVTSSGELIPEIDGLRFLAIASVLLHHTMSIYLRESGRSAVEVHSQSVWAAAGAQSWLVQLAYSGHFGVNLFFAISGFILALPFASRSFSQMSAPNLKNYYLRRVTRIEPPYAICLVIFFFFQWLVRDGEPVALFPHLLASLFYAHGLIYGAHSTINSVAWSLEIEIQFYLLVPLLVKVFRLRNAALRRGLLLACIAGGGWLSQHVIYPSGSMPLILSLANFAHYFLVGFLLADLYLYKWFSEEKRSWLGDLLTLAAGAGLFGVLNKYGQFYFALPLLVLLLYLGCFWGKLSNALIRLRWVVLTGGMCYTFYLYHVPIVSGLLSKTGGLMSATRPLGLDFLGQCLLVVPLVFVLCSWWYVVTEKPFMRWSLSAKPTATPEQS
jgi:peptidoglycan/LPS O-acetylase OafA/YrhL